MKKSVAFITVLCLIVSACLVAFAYGQAPSTVDWVSNISCDAEGNIIVTTTAEMKAAAAYTWQVAIFTEAPTFPDGDDGFSQVYKRSDTGSFEKDAEFASDATYVGGKNGCGAAGDTLSIAATGLVSGQTYYAMFAANSDGGNGWSWLNKAYQFTYEAPAPTRESWIADMEVTGDGVVDIEINMPDGTWWSEVSIFTQEQQDPQTILDNKLNRGTRNAVISGAWKGTVGPNNTDYDLPFDFVDGTTYYVYVSRCFNPYGSTLTEVWDVNPVAYRFTYEAPAPIEETWITDATVVDEGLVNLTFGNLGDDTSWSEIAIFTEDRGALDFNTIYASALSRPGNHSVWGGHKEGTVGTNGQFAFDLVDGTTYYVYVVRNAGGVWDDDHLIKPFSFTYNAPQETPDPTPTPTVVPDDDENETADISVALYAITALAGAGAVVAIKRKKA